MRTFTDLVGYVRAGHRPVVEFLPGCAELEGYPESGMWARVIDARPARNDQVRVTFDFAEFEQRNVALESASYYPKDGSAAFLTAREVNAYAAAKDFHFNADDSLSTTFRMEESPRLDLYRHFLDSGAQSGMAYVAWLEELALMAPLPAPACSESDSDEYDRLVEAGIELSGAFSAADSRGAAWAVQWIRMERDGYDPTVVVRLDGRGALQAELCQDEVFLRAVNDRLAAAGYDGPALRREEMGMQTDSAVVLEPISAFRSFAEAKGFFGTEVHE